MVHANIPRQVSTDFLSTEPSDIGDELHRRLIINLGRSVGASHLAVQALLRGAADDPQLRQDLLQGIDDQQRNISLVLDNLVQFRLLRRGVLVLDLQSIDLQIWLPPLLGKWRPMALRRGLRWTEQLVSNSLPVRADAERLAQVIANLLSNTIQYTPDGGAVVVISGNTATEAWIRIENSGPGLTPDERQRVFEPFFASASQGTFPKGVGLGLVVTKWLVGAHNGRIELESDIGQGYRFTVLVPLANPALAESNVPD